jgi:hypothetical protein
MDDRDGIGGNRPPSNLESASESTNALNAWLAENPVIQTEDQAKEGKLLADRAKGSLDELEVERDSIVRPLNTQVKEINTKYKAVANPLEGVRIALVGRLSDYALALEREKRRVAEEARLAVEKAEAAAREAERLELEAQANAKAGELGLDIAATTAVADAAFSAYEKAARMAARAEKDTKVKVTGGFGRAIGLKDKETLVLEDATLVLSFMEITPGITEEILKAARAYRKIHGELPPGITATYERSL